jgi:hypothetical protein
MKEGLANIEEVSELKDGNQSIRFSVMVPEHCWRMELKFGEFVERIESPQAGELIDIRSIPVKAALKPGDSFPVKFFQSGDLI